MLSFTDKQFLLHLARAARAHAEIVSGAYKQMQTQKMGPGPKHTWVNMSNDEKLAHKLSEMNAHIANAQRNADNEFEEK